MPKRNALLVGLIPFLRIKRWLIKNGLKSRIEEKLLVVRKPQLRSRRSWKLRLRRERVCLLSLPRR